MINTSLQYLLVFSQYKIFLTNTNIFFPYKKNEKYLFCFLWERATYFSYILFSRKLPISSQILHCPISMFTR